MIENLEQITKFALQKFYSFAQREGIELQIEYVDNLYERRLQLTYNDKQFDDVVRSKDFIKSLNGTMVLPKNIDGIYYILISKAILNDTYFIGTIIHEITHIYDFIDFASEFCDKDFEKVGHHNLYKAFYYWTEFNARKKGYLYYRQIIYEIQNLKLTNEEQINHILNTELKIHYDRLLENLKEYTTDHDATKYIYNIIQFMGRFSVWEELFPEEISANNQLPDYLLNAYGIRIVELYRILNLMSDFNIAKNQLQILDKCIESLFLH